MTHKTKVTSQSSGLTIDHDKASYFFKKASDDFIEQKHDPQLTRGVDVNQMQGVRLNQFIREHNLRPEEFDDDEYTRNQLNPTRKRLLGNMEEAEKRNLKLHGRSDQVKSINEQQHRKMENFVDGMQRRQGAINTMFAAERNMPEFERQLDQSRQSAQRLSTVNHDTTGRIGGALLGGALGAATGAHLGKKHGLSGGRVGLANGLVGAGMGALGGNLLGRKVNERQTGARYQDIRSPHEIAYSL